MHDYNKAKMRRKDPRQVAAPPACRRRLIIIICSILPLYVLMFCGCFWLSTLSLQQTLPESSVGVAITGDGLEVDQLPNHRTASYRWLKVLVLHVGLPVAQHLPDREL